MLLSAYLSLVPQVKQLASGGCQKAMESCHNEWRKDQVCLPSAELLYIVFTRHSLIRTALCFVGCCCSSVMRALGRTFDHLKRLQLVPLHVVDAKKTLDWR